MREQRFDAYQRILRLLEAVRHTMVNQRTWHEYSKPPEALPAEAHAAYTESIQRMMIESASPSATWRRTIEHQGQYAEASALLDLVGPDELNAPLARAMGATADRDETEQARAVAELITTMRKALKSRD